MTDMTAAQAALSIDNGPETPTADGPDDAQETATETPMRTFSSEARSAEASVRSALASVRAELAAARAERDGPMAERIRQLVADEERLRRCAVVFDRSAVST
jgi:hypothetical protein